MDLQRQKKLRLALPILSEENYRNYFTALDALGAAGVPTGADANPADFDGLLLPGGGDVDPSFYHQKNTLSRDIDRALDEMQFRALDRFLSAGKPILGICRGHQILNVYLGGTLIQHLPDGRHARDAGMPRDKAHLTLAERGSWIGSLYGPRFFTNSSHHQAVDTVAPDLIVDQRAEDGVIEGMHHARLPVFSVQWHPERMCFVHRRADTVDGSALLEWFLKQCGRGEMKRD